MNGRYETSRRIIVWNRQVSLNQTECLEVSLLIVIKLKLSLKLLCFFDIKIGCNVDQYVVIKFCSKVSI